MKQVNDTNEERLALFSTIRLSKLQIGSIGVEWTRRCNACCDYCCNECSITETECIDKEALKGWVAHFRSDYPEVDYIEITGGEPFLFYDDLLDFFQCTKKGGFGFSIITNGYWATDDRTTHRMLDPLISAGLRAICVSLDPSHIEWVPLDRIKRLIRVAVQKHDLIVKINGSFYEKDSVRNYFDEDEQPWLRRVREIRDYPVIPAGRAQKNGRKIKWRKQFDCVHCTDGPFVSIRSNGDVFPCCSVSAVARGLCYGNIYSHSPKRIVSSLVGDPFLIIIRNLGFTELERIVRLYHRRFRLPSMKYDVCYLCNEVCDSPSTHAMIGQSLAAFEQELIRHVLNIA